MQKHLCVGILVHTQEPYVVEANLDPAMALCLIVIRVASKEFVSSHLVIIQLVFLFQIEGDHTSTAQRSVNLSVRDM